MPDGCWTEGFGGAKGAGGVRDAGDLGVVGRCRRYWIIGGLKGYWGSFGFKGRRR